MDEERKDVTNESLLAPERESEEVIKAGGETEQNRTRQTVTVELTKYGPLYSYPGSTIVAKTHSKIYRIGVF